MKLFVAGDSFASIVTDQEEGKSWSELLAIYFNYELINVARPAASNFCIALQIDWISERITDDDFVIVMLTDHTRKTLVDLTVKKEEKNHALEYYSWHKDQRRFSHLKMSEEPRLMSTTFFNSNSVDRIRQYYKNWFDIDIQIIEDKLVLVGALCKLQQKTPKFLVCKGGFGSGAFGSKSPASNKNISMQDKKDLTHTDLCILKHQFVPLTSDTILSWSDDAAYINHLDDITHQKLASYFKKYIKS